ncbi:hypothetical protein DKT75_19305 [Leucothrix arctica]|uniref:Uncharacterized protein n=2 Tax=Leucothrix arctica TaxID=1481894 RepID=A0A317C660_9GAMM|nr:hypothetical protein DKT75_19305 [Leucothrix arctica]
MVASASVGLLLVACGTTNTSAPQANKPSSTQQAAVLTQPSTQARLAINKAISVALNGTKVSVAKNAFVNSSQLTLQRNTQDPRGMKGLNGRLLGAPVLHHFSMVKQNGSCYLIDKRTSKRHLLSGVNCKSV